MPKLGDDSGIEVRFYSVRRIKDIGRTPASRRSLLAGCGMLFALFCGCLLLTRLDSACGALLLKTPPVSPLDREYPFIASPNFNWRPAGQPITCIVLHSTAQPDLQTTINWFLTPASKVSAHFVVDKDGRVVEMVPVEARAWHAGVSMLDGVPGVNDYSIGIEMVNRNDGLDPYPDAQVQAVARIILQAQALYPIPDSRIVSHAFIALPPGRKTDPEAFDWDKLHMILRQDRSLAQ